MTDTKAMRDALVAADKAATEVNDEYLVGVHSATPGLDHLWQALTQVRAALGLTVDASPDTRQPCRFCDSAPPPPHFCPNMEKAR